MTVPSQDDVDVVPGVRIPAYELDITAISGSGPGGQHVNRSATRIALQWNVRHTRALRDEQRALVMLVIIEGHSYREAAEVLDIPVGTVMSRIARARQSLEQTVFGNGLPAQERLH